MVREISDRAWQPKREIIKLGIYCFALLIVIALIGRRYLHMMSIRREIDEERSLFQEQP